MLNKSFTFLSNYWGKEAIFQKYGKTLTGVESVIDYIKNNPIKDKIKEARIEGKGGKLYDFVKHNLCPQVLWNAQTVGGKTKNDVIGTTGYIYGDIDDFSNLTHLPEDQRKDFCKNILVGMPYVVMVCDSFGGKGISFLVKCEKVLIHTFNNVWNRLNQEMKNLGLILDRATKNINRQCTLSYDENVYYNPNADNFEPDDVNFDAPVEDEETYVVDNFIADEEQLLAAETNIVNRINNWNPNLATKESYFDHLFFFYYAISCNSLGIKIDAVLNAIQNHCVNGYFMDIDDKPFEKVKQKIQSVYKTYAKAFGKITVKKGTKYKNVTVNEYKHNIALKIEIEMINAISECSYTIENRDFISTFAKRCKKSGIQKSYLINFLENAQNNSELLQKMKIEDKIYMWKHVVDKVYMNPHIVFGSALILNDDDCKQKFELRTSHLKKKNFAIVKKMQDKVWDENSINRHLNQIWKITAKGCTTALYYNDPHTSVYIAHVFLDACVKIAIPCVYVKQYIHNHLLHTPLFEPLNVAAKNNKMRVIEVFIEDNYNSWFVKKDASNVDIKGLWARFTNASQNSTSESLNIVEFIKECAKSGVPSYQLTAFLQSVTINENQKMWFSKYTICDFVVDDYYRTNNWRLGFEFRKGITTEDLLKNFKVDREYKIDDYTKISDLQFELQKNMLIWASPGTGKTTWICNYFTGGKRIILVPVTGALESIESTYGCSVYFEDRKTAKEGDDLIVCTYSSFPKFYNEVLKNWAYNGHDYNLVFDEDHNFAVSSAPDFRGEELNDILHRAQYFKRFIRLSGTPFPIVNSFLDKSYVIKVTRPQQKMYKDIYYTDLHQSLLKRLEKGKQNLVFLQNKKQDGKLGELVEFLKMNGFSKIALINAGEKKSAEYKNLIINERLEDDVEVVICTSVMVEALNIMNDNCATAHFLTFGHHIYVEQLVNRFRNKLPDMTYFYRTEKAYNPELRDDSVNVVELQCLQQDIVESFLTYLPTSITKSDDSKSAVKLLRQQISIFSKGINLPNYVPQKDDLAIAYQAFKKEEQTERSNPAFMEASLGMYGWVKTGEEHDEDNKSAEQIVKLKEFKELKKSEKQILIEQIVKSVSTEKDLDKYNDILKPTTEEEQLDYDFRKNVKYLNKYFDFDDALEMTSNWAKEHTMSEGVWKRMMRQLNIMHAKQMDYFNGGVFYLNWENKDLQTIVRRFVNKKHKNIMYDEQEFRNLYTKQVQNYCEANIEEYAGLCADKKQELHNKIMRTIFTIEQIIKPDNSYRFKITGLNLQSQVYSYNKSVFNWLENQKYFSSEDARDFLVHLQSQIPLYHESKSNKKGKIKFDADGNPIDNTMSSFAAMLTIHDFCEAKHQSAIKLENGKKQKLYGVISFTPEWIDGYQFKKTTLASTEYTSMDLSE